MSGLGVVPPNCTMVAVPSVVCKASLSVAPVVFISIVFVLSVIDTLLSELVILLNPKLSPVLALKTPAPDPKLLALKLSVIVISSAFCVAVIPVPPIIVLNLIFMK